MCIGLLSFAAGGLVVRELLLVQAFPLRVDLDLHQEHIRTCRFRFREEVIVHSKVLNAHDRRARDDPPLDVLVVVPACLSFYQHMRQSKQRDSDR